MDQQVLEHQQNQQQRQEMEQFLFDVRDHFKASLETSEYENTSNIFHMTAAETTEQLLQRCEKLLEQYSPMLHQQKQVDNAISGNCTHTRYKPVPPAPLINGSTNGQHEEASYLDMTACSKKISDSKEYMDLTASVESDKTFRCSTRDSEKRASFLKDAAINKDIVSDHDDHDEDDDEETQIYDICLVSQVVPSVEDDDETLKAITPELELTQTADCPYVDLPASHLAIQKSSKYGQLQRIEKRLFFDQSKKCYCGILNDWLLGYTDGPTASRPNFTLHLKSHGIEIEHFGEGKRRDICFQITTADPSRKFIFQAHNEVDAKEWIHAIEAAIRGDSATIMINARKLPTPPLTKKLSFQGMNGNGYDQGNKNSNDYIYEEPTQLYHVNEPTELLIGNEVNAKQEENKPPENLDNLNDSIAIAKKFEYDVPKCPPQPLKAQTDTAPTESETAGLLNASDTISTANSANCITPTKSNTRNGAEKIDFQTKIKDVHSKLSSQLLAAPTPERLKKAVKKTYSSSSNESEALALTTPPATTSKELKKQKKSNTPNASPQKSNSISVPNSGTNEKSAKNWFLNRLNKTTSSTRNSTIISPTKCKQSEKENLLNSLELCDTTDGVDAQQHTNSSGPTSPILKAGGKSKVNMIINQFESSGHLSMFSVEALAGNAVATFNSFCDNDCNNYEPIMTVTTPPSSFMKKV